MRTYEISRILTKIRQEVNKYKLETIFIRDDVFTIYPKRAESICSVLGEIGISWLCMSRSNLLCRKGDKQLIERMVATGCETIMIGIESYNQRVLDLNLKDEKTSEIDQAIENCKAAGLRIIGFIIFGLPGETEESIRETLDFIKQSGIEFSSNILSPLPGSKIYDDAIRQGKIVDEVQYLKDLHYFWDLEGYLPVNMTSLPDDVIIQANMEVGRLRVFS